MSAVAAQMRPLGVAVCFLAARATVAVDGELDLATAPELEAILNAVIVDLGFADVVLDLGALAFMDGAGVRVITAASERLAMAGHRLVIRRASRMVHRILDICEMTGSVVLEDPAVTAHPKPRPAQLGAEQTAAVPGTPVLKPGQGRKSLRRLESLPADNDVIDGALRLVVALARVTVGGADGVSVSLARHGRLSTVAASDQTIMDMDTDQYATGEGPCVDASVNGRWFHATSLDTEKRWPAFTPKARKLGINAILSNPLMARDRPVGALNIYSRTAGAFSAEAQQLASVFASEVSVIMANAGADVEDEAMAQRLAEALQVRAIISQAQGALMERHQVSGEDSYRMLRRTSQTTNIPLAERAAQIVELTQIRAASAPGIQTLGD